MKKNTAPAYDLYKQYSGRAGGVITMTMVAPGSFQTSVAVSQEPPIRGSIDAAIITLKSMKTRLSHLTDKKNLELASKESL